MVRHTLAIVVVAAAACGSPPRMIRPPTVSVGTPSVVIAADDGSFKLTGDQPVTPPFYSKCVTSEARDDVSDASKENELRLAPERWKDAYVGGAKLVTVTIPGLDQPLHGVLALCEVPDPASAEPGGKTFLVQVPQQYVAAAAAGRISVVFEDLKWTDRHWSPERYEHFYSWQLWLSRDPFPVTATTGG